MARLLHVFLTSAALGTSKRLNAYLDLKDASAASSLAQIRHSQQSRTGKVEILEVHGGGAGHKMTSLALTQALQKLNPKLTVVQTDFWDIVGNETAHFKIFGRTPHDFYGRLLSRRPLDEQLFYAHRRMEWYYDDSMRSTWEPLIEAHFAKVQPDAVVSVFKGHTEAILRGLRRYDKLVPLYSVMTDIALIPRPKIPGYENSFVVCPNDLVADSARRIGEHLQRRHEINPELSIPGASRDMMQQGQGSYEEADLIRTSGLVIAPHIAALEPIHITKAGFLREVIRQAGEADPAVLRDDLLTGLVSFGGGGVGNYGEVVGHLDSISASPRFQLIVLCGTNVACLHMPLPRTVPTLLMGRSSIMPDLMRGSDFLIGKPGGLTVAEAMALQVPMIFTGIVMPHELLNAKYCQGRGYGIISSEKGVDGPELARAVRELLSGARLAKMKEALEALPKTTLQWKSRPPLITRFRKRKRFLDSLTVLLSFFSYVAP